MSEENIAFDLQNWAAANGVPPPPPITPDAIPPGSTPIEAWLQALVAAANEGDIKDNAEAQKGHAEREALTAEAMQNFPAQDEAAQAQMKAVDPTSQMAQQLPQMVGGMAGAISGALGGALQPLSQIPQQLAQTGQQLLQQGMGMMQKAGGEISPEDLGGSGLSDEFLAGDSELGAGGSGGSAGGGGGGIGSTAPMSMLGPAATPTGSTVPTSGRSAGSAVPAPAATNATPQSGMGGYPMMPHGGMAGAGGGGGSKDEKAPTKRVSVPSVKNGAPVQGRIATPPPAAPTVTKNVDGKPVATRRIIVPNERTEAKADSDDKGK
ncbi:hypothetical protein [Mycolicibacterium mengxianglii]|uniref:hypothetical protein n=1 Tax=Mycolicibacterium mengxianglii TaxID=2736649 RepID=UPI0027DA2504|nr:hypothetical protein [Mycolicibacterium mengxianglii]